jgi:hypothetical protein
MVKELEIYSSDNSIKNNCENMEGTITDCKKDKKCVEYNGYKLLYTGKGMAVNTSNDRWQVKINIWKNTGKKM